MARAAFRLESCSRVVLPALFRIDAQGVAEMIELCEIETHGGPNAMTYRMLWLNDGVAVQPWPPAPNRIVWCKPDQAFVGNDADANVMVPNCEPFSHTSTSELA